MKEYGGYIELEINRGEEYYENLVKLNCGRNCLAYLIENKKINKLFLPYFLCDTVRHICKKYRIVFENYYIDEKFSPIFDENLNDGEYLYIVNYYGQLETEYLIKLREKYQNIIIDNANAFFDKPIAGCDTIYSCRKYFGVADGAYLSTTEIAAREYPLDISYDRMQFLLGRFEKTASEFYPEYICNNALFDNEPIKNMSKLTLNLLKGIDYTFVKGQREKNFKYLHNRLGSRNELTLKVPEGPYAYPFMIKGGNDLRKQLQKEKIYIPALWADVLKLVSEDTLEYKFVNNILPLAVDQRYDEEDMEYICNVIENTIRSSNVCFRQL